VTKRTITEDVSPPPSDDAPKERRKAGKKELDEAQARERARQRSGSDD
jgi:hypothetical protein